MPTLSSMALEIVSMVEQVDQKRRNKIRLLKNPWDDIEHISEIMLRIPLK